MSYADDWLSDMAVNDAIWYEEAYRRIGDGIWTKKDGTEIRVKDMESSHIENCIRMLQRQIKEYGIDDIKEGWLFCFRTELKERGIAV